jgi:hypothetical protein
MKINYYHFQYLTLMTEMNEHKTFKIQEMRNLCASLHHHVYLGKSTMWSLHYDTMKSRRLVPTMQEQTASTLMYAADGMRISTETQPTRLTGVHQLEGHNTNPQ